jgi:hypothetical protein
MQDQADLGISMKERTSVLLDPMTAMRPSIDTFFAANLSR